MDTSNGIWCIPFTLFGIIGGVLGQHCRNIIPCVKSHPVHNYACRHRYLFICHSPVNFSGHCTRLVISYRSIERAFYETFDKTVRITPTFFELRTQRKRTE